MPYPVHAWLTVEGLGTRKLHTAGAGFVAILDELPHASYDIDGRTTIEVDPGTPAILADKLGQSIDRVSALWQEPPGDVVGFVLHFNDGNDVGVANLGDDLAIRPWPDAAWPSWGVSQAALPA